MSSTMSLLAPTMRRGVSLTTGSSARAVSRKPTVKGLGSRRSFKTSVSPSVDAHVHAFGRLIKAAVVDKDGKKKTGTKEQFKTSKEEIEGMDEEFIENEKRDAERAIGSEREEVRSSVGSMQASLFDMNIARAKAAVEAASAHANDPMFSVRAQEKAYELHKVNSHFWNAPRLANLFRVSLTRMRISLWVSSMDEQAKAEGIELDDTAERLLAKTYGELDFPADIAQVPDRIRYKLKRDMYFYMDDEVKSSTLMSALRNKNMVHYRESPRLPKKEIPAVEAIEPCLPSRVQFKPTPGKFHSLLYIWDISSPKDMYNRQIVVRETDGTLRTGNWQERRFAEDYRRYIKWPMKVPHVRPDESEPDHVPSYARVPDGFKVEFDKN